MKFAYFTGFCLSKFSSNVKTISAAEAGISATSPPLSCGYAMLLALTSLSFFCLQIFETQTFRVSSINTNLKQRLVVRRSTVRDRERMSELSGFVYNNGHEKSPETTHEI